MNYSLYQELLRDHYHNPRHKGRISNPNFSSDVHHPSCGDKIHFEGIVKNGFLTDVAFMGTGCIICLATASILSEFSKNKAIKEILAIDKKEIQNMIGTQLGPIRLKCALLPLQALQQGIKSVGQ